MSKYTHSALHVLAVALQYANFASGLVAPKYQPLVAAAVALGQAVLAISQHKD